MRNTRKIFIALLVVMTLLVSMATLFASAADQPATLYLTPSNNWKEGNARFAAYFFGNGEKWVSMTDTDKDGVYEVAVPTDKVYPNVIFCRMNPSAAANNWDNKWNQTSDLTIPTSGANHYAVKEGTWDKGGGTWSTFGSTCMHTNLGDAATCTTPQICLDCKDPVVSALGHTYDATHLCSRCNEQATFTVAGSGAHLGTEWDTGNTANDMTYADGVYTKVYTNVAAGSYAFKVARDHDWGTAYPSADKTYSVTTSGSTVTITLKGTAVSVVVEAPHVHSYFYPCDPVCQECYELSNPDAKHDVVHVEAVAATCYENGNVEYWYCSYCGATWTDEALTQVSNQMSIVTPMSHAPATHVEAKAPTCYENGNIEYWYCEACGQAWLDADCTQNTNLLAVVLPMAHAEAKHVEAKAATCTELGNIEFWLCEACGQAWLDAACTLNTNVMSVKLPMADHSYVDGKCSACEAVDPDYVAPTPDANHVLESSALDAAAAGDFADGTVIDVDGFFSLLLGAKSKIDSSSKTWKAEDWGELLAYKSGQRLYLGSKTSTSAYAIKFTTTKAATVTVWWVSNGEPNEDGTGSRPIGILDSDGNIVAQDTTGVAKNAVHISEFELSAAGTYYLGNMVDNNYFFKVEVVEKDAPVEPPHEHNFVDGKCECGEEDPNYVPPHEHSYTAVVTAPTCTTAGYTTYTCECGDSYVGDEVAATGHYCVLDICAVCYLPQPSIVLGDNTVVVPETGSKFGMIQITEAGYYTISANPATTVCIFTTNIYSEGADFSIKEDGSLGASWYVYDTAAQLEPGYYYIAAYLAGEYTVNISKGEAPVEPDEPHVNKVVVGEENKLICTETHPVGQFGPYEFLTVVIPEDGHYKFVGTGLGYTIYTIKVEDPNADFTPNTGTSWGTWVTTEADLTAGTYWIGIIYVGGVGEYTATVEKSDIVPPHEHVWSDATCTEPQKCECGETQGEALGHSYAEGVCSVCGAEDPDYTPETPVDPDPEQPEQPENPEEPGTEEPEVELNFFQKIIKAITDFFKGIGNWFKGLFAKK